MIDIFINDRKRSNEVIAIFLNQSMSIKDKLYSILQVIYCNFNANYALKIDILRFCDNPQFN